MRAWYLPAVRPLNVIEMRPSRLLALVARMSFTGALLLYAVGGVSMGYAVRSAGADLVLELAIVGLAVATMLVLVSVVAVVPSHRDGAEPERRGFEVAPTRDAAPPTRVGAPRGRVGGASPRDRGAG